MKKLKGSLRKNLFVKRLNFNLFVLKLARFYIFGMTRTWELSFKQVFRSVLNAWKFLWSSKFISLILLCVIENSSNPWKNICNFILDLKSLEICVPLWRLHVIIYLSKKVCQAWKIFIDLMTRSSFLRSYALVCNLKMCWTWKRWWIIASNSQPQNRQYLL
jgi:hypothetical protein